MPLKKGPNGTFRYYSGSTGRYVRDPRFLPEVSKVKKSRSQKEKERMEMVRHLAEKSKDEHLFELYEALESMDPGCVRFVNAKYYDKLSDKEREFDIITKDNIYEVKSGKSKHKNKQYLAQMKIAERLKKGHVVFSPDSTNYQIKCLRKQGIRVYKTIEDLFTMEEKEK